MIRFFILRTEGVHTAEHGYTRIKIIIIREFY